MREHFSLGKRYIEWFTNWFVDTWRDKFKIIKIDKEYYMHALRRLKNQLIKLNTNVKKNKKYNNIYNKYCIYILSIK